MENVHVKNESGCCLVIRSGNAFRKALHLFPRCDLTRIYRSSHLGVGKKDKREKFPTSSPTATTNAWNVNFY
ncbi:hypothetical protein P8452_60509 [Trifolium repens]|nr:hypothetical protein P8452_60509 [Trifolium repens]